MNEDLEQVLWGLWQKREQDKWVFYNRKTGTRYLYRPKLMKTVGKTAGVQSPPSIRKPLIFLVPEARLELAQGCPRGILSPLRLPIPPLRQQPYFSPFSQFLARGAGKILSASAMEPSRLPRSWGRRRGRLSAKRKGDPPGRQIPEVL